MKSFLLLKYLSELVWFAREREIERKWLPMRTELLWAEEEWRGDVTPLPLLLLPSSTQTQHQFLFSCKDSDSSEQMISIQFGSFFGSGCTIKKKKEETIIYQMPDSGTDRMVNRMIVIHVRTGLHITKLNIDRFLFRPSFLKIYCIAGSSI